MSFTRTVFPAVPAELWKHSPVWRWKSDEAAALSTFPPSHEESPGLATVLGTIEERRKGSSWARKYPPLLAMALAVLIAVAVLPSALNLPQANPTETLEYAPVPPSDNDPPPPPAAGNLASLGLASSPGLVSGPSDKGVGTGGTGKGPGPAPAVAQDLPPPPPAAALPPAIKTPSTKGCVGKPPRQTEDPLAPPCVASFSGDNFGATYQGVSKDEISVL